LNCIHRITSDKPCHTTTTDAEATAKKAVILVSTAVEVAVEITTTIRMNALMIKTTPTTTAYVELVTVIANRKEAMAVVMITTTDREVAMVVVEQTNLQAAKAGDTAKNHGDNTTLATTTKDTKVKAATVLTKATVSTQAAAPAMAAQQASIKTRSFNTANSTAATTPKKQTCSRRP
jgi:hypothetical protein